MPIGLVDIEVQRHHQIQRAQRRVEGRAVGHRQHRIAGEHEQRPQLSWPGRGDLIGDQRRREGAENVWEIADPGTLAVVAERARAFSHVLDGDDLMRHQCPTRPVEVAGHHVQRVDQETDQGAVMSEAGAGAPVGDCRSGGGEFARQRSYGLGGHPGAQGGVLRRKVRAQRAQRVDARGLRRDGGPVLQPLGEHHVQQREHQPGIRIGPHRNVFVGRRGLGASRIHHQDTPAAFDDRRQIVADPRYPHRTAV